MKAITLFALVSFCACLNSAELNKSYIFNQIASDEGLSQVTVTDIIQDSSGYLWIATNDKLNRFNGNRFNYYGDSDSGLGRRIQKLLYTSNGSLYAASDTGFYQYDQASDMFITVQGTQQFNGAVITDLLELDSGIIMLATDDGLLIEYHTKSDTSRVLPLTLNTQEPLRINSLFIKGNHLWLVTSAGVFQYSENSTQRICSVINALCEISDRRFIAIDEASDGTLIFYGYEALYFYQANTKSLTDAALLFKDWRLTDTVILDHEEINGKHWFASDRGLFITDLEKKGYKHFSSKENSTFHPSSNSISKIYKDAENNVWLGHYASGVDHVTGLKESLSLYHPSNQQKECRFHNEIQDVHIDTQRHLWISTTQQEVFKVELDSLNCTLMNGQLALTSLVTKFFQPNDTEVWMATLYDGFVIYNTESLQVEKYHSHQNSNDETVSSVYAFEKAQKKTQENTVLIGSERGIAEFDLRTRAFTSNESSAYRKIDSSGIIAIKHAGNYLWLATVDGVRLFDIELGEYIDLATKLSTERLITTIVHTIMLSQDGHVWLASEGLGLIEVTPEFQTKFYNERMGLPNNTVYTIEEDSDGFIWGVTNRGLFKLDRINNKIQILNKDNGLQGNEFFPASAYDREKKALFFGGINGFNRINQRIFDDADIDSTTRPNITRAETNRFRFLPTTLVEDNQSIVIVPDDKYLAIEFATPVFEAHNNIKHRYRISSVSPDWINISNANNILLASLPFGSHLLEYGNTDIYGRWNDSVYSKRLVVHPPIWLTWWAKLSYIFLLISSTVAFYFYRTRAIRVRALQLEQKVTTRTRELASEKDKVERLLDKKSDELAIVSHELRTPLTLVKGPVEQALSQIKDSFIAQKLEMASRNTDRLIRMVDQLLFVETFKIKSLNNKQLVAVSASIGRIAESMQDIAKQKHIRLTINRLDQVAFEMVPDSIEKIALNLLSNAIKYTPEHGTIEFSAIRKQTDYVIAVEDSGIGIKPENQATIFDRFQRAEHQSEAVVGYGIGLSLVKELVEFHQGKIEVESNPDQGSCFIVTLPIMGESANQGDAREINDLIADEDIVGLVTPVTNTLNNDSELDDSTRQTILVVEDNQDMRRYIESCLEPKYHCITAADGEQGMQLAKAVVPDIIVSDVMMPKMDGFELTQSLRKSTITNHIPIVLLTARGDRTSRLRGWREKADEYMVKPFDEEELNIRLASLLELREILQSKFRAFVSATYQEPVAINQLAQEDNQINEQKQFLAQLQSVISDCYINPDIKISELAKKLAMSERQLSRKLKATCETKPLDFLRNFRLEKSYQLLKDGMSPSSVYLEVGFTSHSYFTRCFKAYFEKKPSDVSQLEK